MLKPMCIENLMNLIEVSVRADGEAAEALSELFNRLGQGGAIIEETPTAPRSLCVKTYLYVDEQVAAKRRALEEGLWHLSQLYPMPPAEFRELKEDDWANAWKQFHPVQHVGERIVIKPTWREHTPQPHELVIELDPGMAFGTGQHPSTRLCLLALEHMNLSEQSVLDVGTGSGILAIAALLLGARELFGCDVDKQSVEVARENAALNRVTERVTFAEGTLDELALPTAHYAVIIINILAPVIIELLPLARPLLKVDGCVVLSGLIASQEDEVCAALTAVGLRVVTRAQDNDWVMLVGAV